MSALLAHRLSDERLGRRLAAGEAPAFDELYRRYVHRLAAYGTQLLGDGAAGDDVAQVALMRAYQALRGGDVPDHVRPWLYRIAHNAAIDLVRHRREQPTETLPEREAQAGDAAPGALMAAVAALPERQRQVYVLRELHGLRIDETAAELALTTQQVEQSLFAARNRLAEQLVFGERLGCATVRKLAAGPLDLRERRALKTHVRSCPACRNELGGRGIALSLLPLQWLRLPSAVKAGVAVATATVAVGVPLAATTSKPHAHARVLPGVREVGPDVPLSQLATRHGASAARPVRHVRRRAPVHVAPQPTAPVFAVPATPVAAPTTRRAAPVRPRLQPAAPAAGPVATAQPAPPSATTTTSDGGGTVAATDPTTTTPTTTTEDGGGGGGDTTTTTTTTTTTDSSGDSSADGSGDSSLDGGTPG